MKLSEDTINLLKGKNFASLATVNKDGSPQVSIVWIDYEDEIILINTAKGRVKTNNMQRDPRVSISITDSENPYYQVTIKGRVIEITEDGAVYHINSLAKKYLNEDRFPVVDNEIRVKIKIKPEKTYVMK
tara:strand:+ start:3692 stop:4081 length:390 start_codon:yes stop_codon:yes gene_type:complete